MRAGQVVTLNGRNVVGVINQGVATVPAKPVGLDRLISLLTAVLGIPEQARRERLGMVLQSMLAAAQGLGTVAP